MKLNETRSLSSDVLIIGGGGAALRAAISAREAGADVLVVSKAHLGNASNTYISKSMFAASTGKGDSPENHLRDTLSAGRFINDRGLALKVTEEILSEPDNLTRFGVQFRMNDGKRTNSLAPGHTKPRGHSSNNMIGSEYIAPLKEYALKIGVRVLEKVFISRLFPFRKKKSENRIAAATGISKSCDFVVIKAASIILATGGFGAVYLNNNNAGGITGDGLAMGYHLGIPLKDMEFVQFYPTGMGRTASRIVPYEALVAGLGAVLLNSVGDNIVEKHGLSDPMDLTRDRLARAIYTEIKEGRGNDNCVTMDISSIPEEILNRFKGTLLPAKWTPQETRFMVAPTAHFCMGGLETDTETSTTLPGLFAAGEITGGVHGANRLASNALSEVFALSNLAGKNAARFALEQGLPDFPEEALKKEKARLENTGTQGETSVIKLRQDLKKLMWEKAGIIRTRTDLEEALENIHALTQKRKTVGLDSVKSLFRLLEFENMLIVSEMVIKAALKRAESRGAHYRVDFPEEDNRDWLLNIIISKEKEEMKLEKRPVDSSLLDLA